MYYKSHLCTRLPNVGRRGRKNAKAYHFHNRPKVTRQPLDKCDAALWRVLVVRLERIWCQFDTPWVSPDGRKVSGRWIIRHIVELEHFRGQVLKFVVNKDSVRDMRDDETMSHDEFVRFVSERTKTDFKLP